MIRWLKEKKGLIRGVPTAVLLSILIHAGLLVVAGGLVIFSVVLREEKKFVPPAPVERPQMELRRPRVRVQRTAQPRATARITARTTVQTLPDVQLPEISLGGAGLTAGIGGFEMLPDPSEIKLYGGRQSLAIGNDFEGTFYSLLYDRQGRRTGAGPGDTHNALRRFFESGWNPLVFAPYYRAPQKLYTTHFMIPPIDSSLAPVQFGLPPADQFDPARWMIHYKGKIAHPEGGRFRFRGFADDFMVVRVGGKIVGDYSWSNEHSGFVPNDLQEHKRYWMGIGRQKVGNWFELKPGVPVEMEVIFGEGPGGICAAMLVIEQEGVRYPRNRHGAPIFPMFQTAETPVHVIEEIEYWLPEGDAEVRRAPIFNVF